jgi:hypothetical protein
MAAVQIRNEDLRAAVRGRAAVGRPGWHKVQVAPGIGWGLIIEDWSAASGGEYGDYAEGVAHVQMYARGPQRYERHIYVERTEAAAEDYSVCERIEIWTVEMVDGEDVARDQAEIRYEHSFLSYPSPQSAQKEVGVRAVQNLCDQLDAGLAGI